MQDNRKLVTSAISGLLALGFGVSAGSAYAADNEKCFGIAKTGQNGCNSNVHKHSCAGHAKIDNDPMDFVPVPKGSCLKVGGKLDPSSEKQSSPDK